MHANPPTLRELFDRLVDLAPEARAAFYEQNRVGAEERDRLERMLASRSDLDSGLPSATPEELARSLGEDDAIELRPGSRVGAFDLISVVGEGGSSTVFRAGRTVDGVRQIVALKLLRRGVYTPDAIRQFRRERLALSQLQHPGIARLIEGGVTEAGIAYIALDFVDGMPITDYVREHKLDLRARLALFLKVCRAVEAAHRALIVHRDLKPPNVLVTADGEVKLLDFGIAKLLDADDETQTRLPAFTPAYAAPEQRLGGPITTATDVYALGVLLGEIITGQRLNDGSGRTPSGYVGADNAPGVLPAAPSVTRRQLRGDLDNIVMKAIAAEPERRYASARAFAEDIESLLDRRPVAAHPPSTWYRTRKFVVRHRGGVAASALFALTILCAFGLTLWQARIARQEAERANAVRDFLVSVFKSADATVPTDTRPSVDDIIKSATDRLSKQTSLPDALRADLLLTLAQVAASVGSYDKALQLLDEGEPILDRVAGADDPRKWDAILTRTQVMLEQTGATDVVRKLEPLRGRMLARRDATGIEGLMILGHAYLAVGREQEALSLTRQAREEAEVEGAPLDTMLMALIGEASALIDALHFQEGLARAEEALNVWHRMGDPTNREIAELTGSIAIAAEATGDIARAESTYRQAIALDERFFDNKPNVETAWDLGIYGTFLIAQGRLDEAEPYATRGLEMRRAVMGEGDEHTLYAVAGMGKLRYGQRKYADAEHWFTQGIDTCRRTSLMHQVCSRLLALRADSEAMQSHFDEAERDIAQAEDLQRRFNGETSAGYAYILDHHLTVQIKRNEYAAALAMADRVLAIYHGVKGGMLQAELGARFRRAVALFELDRNDEALSEILDIEPKYAATFPANSLRAEIVALKARSLARANRYDEARVAAQDALSMDPESKIFEPAIAKDLGVIAAPPAARTRPSHASR